MTRLRYVKHAAGPAQPRAAAVRHTVRSLRAVYETEPEIAAALLSRPLEPAASPEIFVQFANVAMHLAEDRVVQIGAATVGVACSYDGQPGYYVLAMPMEGEFVVIAGREKYGEPKKLAQTRFSLEGDHVNAQVIRHGVAFLELDGRLGEASDRPTAFTELFYCYKALPACRPDEERSYTSLREVDEGRVILRESAHDPLVDVPVRRIVRMEFAEGATRTSGEVLRAVPGEWLSPFLSQRYDEPHGGIEVALASETGGANA
jgi:acetoacetate decarboxylase